MRGKWGSVTLQLHGSPRSLALPQPRLLLRVPRGLAGPTGMLRCEGGSAKC